MNLVVTLVSFTMITPFWKVFDADHWTSFTVIYDYGFGYAIHSLPLICSTLNSLLLSDTIPYMSDVWVLALVSAAYLLLTFTFTIITGRGVYPFLTYQGWFSWVFVCVIIPGAISFHLIYSIFI